MVPVGDVIIHRPVAVGDLPGLLALCCHSALGAGVSVRRALRFASAVGRALVNAFGQSASPPLFTLVCQDLLRLTTGVDLRSTGSQPGRPKAGGGLGRQILPTRRTSAPTVGATMFRLVVAIRSGTQLGHQGPSRSPNAGRFPQVAQRKHQTCLIGGAWVPGGNCARDPGAPR